MVGRLGWFFAYRFFSSCLPYLPVATACFLARGLSLGEVLTLSTIYCVGTAVLGIPLAQLADRWGYRRALVLGASALAVGAAAASFADGQIAFIAAQLALAAGAALDSGTDSAYLYQETAASGASLAEYRALEARSASIKLFGNVVGFALGGVLAAASTTLPFAAGALFAAVAALCASRLSDVRGVRPSPAPMAGHVAGALRTVLAMSDLRRLFVLAALCAAMSRVALTTAAPYLESLDVSLTAIGFLTALGAVGAALAARRAMRLADRFGDHAILAALPVALLACTIALGIGAGAAAVALALVPQVLAGLHAPIWRAHLNARVADSSRRATVLAIDGTFARLLWAAIAVGLAAVSAVGDSRSALVGCAAVAGVLLLAVAVMPARGSRRMRVAWAASGIAALVILRGPIADAVAGPADARVAVATDVREPSPEPAAALVPPARFQGMVDDDILRRMCEEPVSKLEPLGQGTTVKFKATVGDDVRAAVRPSQSLPQGYFRADIAAYRLSRELGLGTVPPACERSVARADLRAAAGPRLRERLDAEIAWRGDEAPTAVVYWVKGVRSADLEKNRRAWRALLSQASDLAAAGPGLRQAAAEGSRLAVWDFLIANWDRWSGSNTFRIGEDGPYVWLDNAAGFGRESRRARAKRAAELARVERFSREVIDALRAASDDDLRAALAPAGLPERSITELLARRRIVIDHVDALIAQHGEDAVLIF